MQLQSGIPPAGGTKSPPTPLVQTPVGGSHSRSSSHASSQGASSLPPSNSPTMEPTETEKVLNNKLKEIDNVVS